jgi:hypothetical protein
MIKYGARLQTPPELLEKFTTGHVALFLGAGISMPAGAPDLKRLVEPLRDKLSYAGSHTLDLPQVVSLSVLDDGRAVFRNQVITELEKLRDTTVHELIVQLPTDMFLTTNYDPYLVHAARKADLSPVVIDEDKLVTRGGDSNPKIVHLYGNTHSPLASEDDLITFDRYHPALAMLLEHTLLTRTVLFLGFSLRDYNVLNHLLTAQYLVGGPPEARTHFAFMLMAEHNEAQIALWNSRRLKIFGYYDVPEAETSETFVTFVKQLAAEVKRKTHAKLERENVVFREESAFFEQSKSLGRKPRMRRESTFSVLGIPDDLKRSGFDEAGYKVGRERKRLYEEWIKLGQLDLILNIDPTYAKSRYDGPHMLAHLQALRSSIAKHVDSNGFRVALRSHATARDSYASLGDDVLITSDAPIKSTKNSKAGRHSAASGDVAYKRTSVIRDRVATKVFNEFFDQEMESFTRTAVENFGVSGRNDKKRRRIGKLEAIKQIDSLIKQLK